MEIDLGGLPFDLCFHPSSPLVAVGLITGQLHVCRYNTADGADSRPQRVFAVKAHQDESCRAVRFVESGNVILTGSADCSILATDVETGKAIARMEDAHEDAINILVNLTESTIASGDDEGCIKVWDTRQRVCCNSFHVHEDYISDITYVADTMQVLATSGDGTLSVSSLRKNKVQSQSEFSEDELLSVVVMKNGRKVICGTQTGALLLYSWGYFKDCSDRFPGHPMSVDTLLKVDEDTLISGSWDGVIRLVGILPNKILQPLAEHSEFPIEKLDFSNDRSLLGSISHDQMLKLWDMQELMAGQHQVEDAGLVEDDSDEDGDDMDVDAEPAPSRGAKKKSSKDQQGSSKRNLDFFADL